MPDQQNDMQLAHRPSGLSAVRRVESHVCEFQEENFGHRCAGCGAYFAFGCAPWDIADDDGGDMDDWPEGQ